MDRAARIATRYGTLCAVLTVCLLDAPTAVAQVDLAGSWSSRSAEDVRPILPVDYTGLPLNAEGRAKALAYSESQRGMIERQCVSLPPYYITGGPFGLFISAQTDPVNGSVIAWVLGAWEDRPQITIWMDGRPHPSASAPHLRAGFTTGHWEGRVLVASTTHIKAGMIRQNGAPMSDLATMTTRLLRHGDLLTVFVAVDDPVYLSEPLMLSKTYRQDGTPVNATSPPCITGFEGAPTNGRVPHYLPGQNPFINELANELRIPVDAALGGAEMMYPEYRKKLKETFDRARPR